MSSSLPIVANHDMDGGSGSLQERKLRLHILAVSANARMEQAEEILAAGRN